MANELERLCDRARTHTGEHIDIALRDAYRIGLSDNVTKGTFEWAMLQMRQGKTVRRKSCVFQLWMRSSKLLATPGSCGIDFENVEGTDWEIVPEPKPEPEGHDFAWAMEQMRNGKRVRRKGWGTWPALVSGQFVSVTDADQKDWILEPEGESR